MSRDGFEWDPLKDIANQRKHGVSFKEACKAFYDPRRIIVRDKTHSLNEDRFLYWQNWRKHSDNPFYIQKQDNTDNWCWPLA